MSTVTTSRREDLKAQLTTALTAIRDLAKKAEDEGRDLTDNEREDAQKFLNEAKAARASLEKIAATDDLAKAVAELGEGVGLNPEPTRTDPTKAIAPNGKGHTLGEQIVDDEMFQAWQKSVAPNGQVSEKRPVGASPAFDAKGMNPYNDKVRAKALITSTTATDGVIAPQNLGLLEGIAFRPFTIRDVITIGRTDTDTVTYVRELSRTNNAAVVPEATTTNGVGIAGGVKPESAFTLEKVTETVSVIAHTLPATKQVLSDAAQMRTLIDNFLRDGLVEELEDQIITGDGTGDNFTGILNTSGVQSQTFDTDILKTARKARTKVRVTGRAIPNAYVMHPNDWEAFDLLTDNQGRYYFGGPLDLGVPRLWGLPVVESEAVTEGSPICGDFRRAVLWDRQQATVSVTDSHSDFFVRNLVMFLAELRAAFGVLRPAAFCTFDMEAGS